MTWALIVWVALTILFVVLVNTVNADPCAESDQARRAGCELGQDMAPAVWTTIGLTVGFMGFVVLALVWFMTRPPRRLNRLGEA